MLVILDGPDGSGKTTLAAGLHAVFGVPTVKFVVPDSDMDLLGRIQRTLTHGMTTPVILDRWHYPADFIYCKVVEDRVSVLAPYESDIIHWLKENHVLYLHITAGSEILRERFNEQKLLAGEAHKDYIDACHLRPLRKEYMEYMRYLYHEGVAMVTLDSLWTPEAQLHRAVRVITDHYIKLYLEGKLCT